MSQFEQQAFKTLADNVVELMPGLEKEQISLDGKLSDYGCNSIDRSDIVWKTLDDLSLDIPIVEFAQVRDIRSLTLLMVHHLEKK